MLMEEALDGAGLKPENISHTLLVGGSTRIPIITKTIELIIYYGHLPTKLNTGVIYLLNTDIEIYCYSILLIIFILINYRKKN